MQTTTDSCERMTSLRISPRVTASVVPPAGSVKIHSVRALRVVAAKVDVGKAPPAPIRDLRAETIHVVVIAVDGDDVGTVDRGAEDLVRLEIVRDEDVARQPEPRGVRRHAVGEIPRRRA